MHLHRTVVRGDFQHCRTSAAFAQIEDVRLNRSKQAAVAGIDEILVVLRRVVVKKIDEVTTLLAERGKQGVAGLEKGRGRPLREFAARELAPNAREYDESEAFPIAHVKQMAELGLMGLTIPEQYGGAGAGTMEYAIAMEEVARADAATSVILTVNVSLATGCIL